MNQNENNLHIMTINIPFGRYGSYLRVIFGKIYSYLSDLKIQTQRKVFLVNFDNLPDFRDMIIQSANDLIQKCEDYRIRHKVLNKKQISIF